MQCKLIIQGARQVNAALDEDDSVGVWFGLQGLLISASNASKLLSGSRTDPVLEARRPLRESVEVSDDSPLSSRRIRNDFEHFDERLEEWFSESANHTYVGRTVGRPGSIKVAGQTPTDVFGQFDQYEAVVSFWERSVEVNPLVAEAQRVLQVLAAIED